MAPRQAAIGRVLIEFVDIGDELRSVFVAREEALGHKLPVEPLQDRRNILEIIFGMVLHAPGDTAFVMNFCRLHAGVFVGGKHF